ncbi:hypothetical protein PLICRDRAFT_188741 [Plicaturopsis crispa FD-325 SS-3]|nr:hypothetical protein PLICRDRAFT_188741 [Plicaturopsis crispa FD-325 SS-3]
MAKEGHKNSPAASESSPDHRQDLVIRDCSKPLRRALLYFLLMAFSRFIYSLGKLFASWRRGHIPSTMNHFCSFERCASTFSGIPVAERKAFSGASNLTMTTNQNLRLVTNAAH